MRKLQAKDIFSFGRVVIKIGIKDEIKAMTMKANSIKDIAREEMGFDLLVGILEKAMAKNGEKALFEFFADIMGKDKEEVKTMSPVLFIDALMETANIEEWKAFFSRVAALMK